MVVVVVGCYCVDFGVVRCCGLCLRFCIVIARCLGGFGLVWGLLVVGLVVGVVVLL